MPNDPRRDPPVRPTSGPRRFADARASGWWLDAGLYALSAAFAAATAGLAAVPLQREWGRIALPTYLVATALALVGGTLARSGRRQRVALALAVCVGAAVVPLIVAVGARAATYPGHIWGWGRVWARLPFVRRNRWSI